MRLLNVHTLQFREFYGAPEPYIVTSHRWSAGNEAMIDDIERGQRTNTTGYKKVQGFANFVRDHFTHVDWMWIDTCCVNQASDREVSEAVNSMFRWYSQAEACLAYLADVDYATPFAQSEWFRRNRTLQELLAPRLVLFLAHNWNVIGCKGDRTVLSKARLNHTPSLETSVAAISKIPRAVIVEFTRSYTHSVDARLKWMNGRETTRAEDMIYSLFGIFDVTLPVIYGEGVDRAKRRLLREIYDTAHYAGLQPAPSNDIQFNEVNSEERLRNDKDRLDNQRWKNEKDRSNYASAKTSIDKGLTAIEQNDYYTADTHFQEAQECLENLPAEQIRDDLSLVKAKLAVCTFHVRDKRETEEALLAVTDSPLADDCQPLELCEARHLLAQVYVKTGKLNMALELCQICCAERHSILGNENHFCYESLSLLARIYELRGDSEEAARCLDSIRAKSQSNAQPSLFSGLWPPVRKQWQGFIQSSRPVGLPTLIPTDSLSGTGRSPIAAAFSADGKSFAFETNPGVINLWDVASGKKLVQVKTQHASNPARRLSLINIAFSGDGKHFGALSRETEVLEGGPRFIRLWESWETESNTGRIVSHTSDCLPLHIAFSPQGNLCVLSDHGRVLQLTDLVSGNTLSSGETRCNYTEQAISLDGMLIARANDAGLVWVCRMATDNKLFELQIEEGKIMALRFSGDGTKLAIVSLRGIAVWSITANCKTKRLDFDSDMARVDASTIQVSFNGDLAAYRKPNVKNEYVLREIAQGSRVTKMRSPSGVSLVNLWFAPDDQILAAVNERGAVAFWDVADFRSENEVS